MVLAAIDDFPRRPGRLGLNTPSMTKARIPSLDVIRGVAILGVLAVNADGFAAPIHASLKPDAWRWLNHFEMGPLEWIWRWVTYAHRSPFVRRREALATPLE
ncbi:DUF418 domain-containing protein [Luteibacter aegosomatis]|uniref:DUF418 domain-containing protein n=1 Tax=Luteibacter aegosomatis TaxID=2911537 RepID=UPI001FF7624F|nr:DUF418 domain-containing protein [Luteibacter aegosomatis]UPG85234.1 DUF418 domain-containing protein [Luteibacter aegosomatis]